MIRSIGSIKFFKMMMTVILMAGVVIGTTGCNGDTKGQSSSTKEDKWEDFTPDYDFKDKSDVDVSKLSQSELFDKVMGYSSLKAIMEGLGMSEDNVRNVDNSYMGDFESVVLVGNDVIYTLMFDKTDKKVAKKKDGYKAFLKCKPVSAGVQIESDILGEYNGMTIRQLQICGMGIIGFEQKGNAVVVTMSHPRCSSVTLDCIIDRETLDGVSDSSDILSNHVVMARIGAGRADYPTDYVIMPQSSAEPEETGK